MSNLSSKRGFTLLEVLVSLGVFSMIFICMMCFNVTSLNIKKDIKSINNNVSIMETLKNNIIYTMTFTELQGVLMDNRTFINSENMTVNKIQNNVMDAFSKASSVGGPYIKLSYLKYESKLYTLRLSLYAGGPNNIVQLQCDFYKGYHEW
ncbi:type II secretion system GspH family protein [Clostridium bowmanii]|uniref:PulJ/GspJ family protein n=1 Tax=Clostridium bowmanii TaxID=132925 RepID=UPI001C0E273E|nr:type II secretion system protein [Clostridium bowmanii]MBU3189141.1 type II secretion system GspH family protein [Clostridium bowmanii]MCA1073027.1 type II secretion system GspH family protein [Clostridium bowmanii]